jgi:two-component system chemotaxis response regulator CheY
MRCRHTAIAAQPPRSLLHLIRAEQSETIIKAKRSSFPPRAIDVRPMMTNSRYEKLRVLIVEDNGFVRSLVAKVLYNIGVRDVAQATDGSTGLEQLATFKPDVVICDIAMVPMGGLDFLKAVRAGVAADIPVIFLTSHTESEIVMQAKALGADSFLAKPVSTGKLKDRLDRVLSRKSDRPPPPRSPA